MQKVISAFPPKADINWLSLCSGVVEHFPERAALALGMGRAGRDDLLFPRWDGQVRSPHWLTQNVRIRRSPTPPPGTPCLATLFASGMDPLTVSRRLGHGSPTITLTVYGHLIEGTDTRAAELMENMFGKLRIE